MSTDERQALEALKDGNCPSNIEDGMWQDDDADDMNFSDVLNGTEPLTISHAGGEFSELARDVLGDLWKMDTFNALTIEPVATTF
ncbi:hypothetical protein DFH29DRAFT_1010867 [Suillus ampliporus]|nr:hypothetical protein DFH29DRAFT_1010867 [Suillus ampliporus]